MDAFLRERYLYWLEALSLLRGMTEGILATQKLERILRVCVGQEVSSGILVTIGAIGSCRTAGARPGCVPIHTLPSRRNREQPSPGIQIGPGIQPTAECDKAAVPARAAQ